MNFKRHGRSTDHLAPHAHAATEEAGKSYDAVARPNVFAVLLEKEARVEKTTVLNDELKAKGFSFVGLSTVAKHPFAMDSRATLLVYFTYCIGADEHLLDTRHARMVARIAKIFRRHGVHGWLLSRERLAQFETMPDGGSVIESARRGDRDLDLLEGESFVRDLSQNRIRSSIWLVRRGNMLFVRKAYSAGNDHQIVNEMAARNVLRDHRVVEISDRRGPVLYLPFIDTTTTWRGRILDFFPREQARRVFDFLGDVARSGHSMIDINPSAFLFCASDTLKVVDFEFFSRTVPASSFAESRDYVGDFGDLPAPAKNGYRRYWYDALGGELEVVMSASRLRYGLRKFLHVLFYRIPRRTAVAAAELTKQVSAQIVRLAGSRKGSFRI